MTTKTRTRQKPEVRQAAILDAALKAFSEAGFSGARMDDIAAHARVSKGTLYLYYPTKDALFEALVRRDIGPKLGFLTTFLNHYNGPLELALSQAIELVASVIEKDQVPIYPKLLLAEGGRFPDLSDFYRREVFEVGITALAGLFERAMQRGAIETHDPLVLAHLFVSPIAKSAVWHLAFGGHNQPTPSVRDVLRAHVTLFLKAIKKAPTP